MIKEKIDTETVCRVLECQNLIAPPECKYDRICKEHKSRGYFQTGQSYDQYSIIEADFLDFIKNVPLEEEHLNVYSPILRDIILRTCTQIEIFFKEWAKYVVELNDEKSHLAQKFLKPRRRGMKSSRNWNFGDFYKEFKPKFSHYNFVYIRLLDYSIKPFDSWESEKTPPFWWTSYNSLKHSGSNYKKDATLRNALWCLAALFQMHLVYSKSKQFLESIKNAEVNVFLTTVTAREGEIKTPIGSKRFLFAEGKFLRKDKVVLATNKTLSDAIRGRGVI